MNLRWISCEIDARIAFLRQFYITAVYRFFLRLQLMMKLGRVDVGPTNIPEIAYWILKMCHFGALPQDENRRFLEPNLNYSWKPEQTSFFLR